MARSADETARTLMEVYEEVFGNESYSFFRINWPELRSLAGVNKLTEEYLREVNGELNGSGYVLVPMDNFLLVASEDDFGAVRAVPPRTVENFLPGDEDDDESEDSDDFGDDEDDDDSPPSRNWSKIMARAKNKKQDSVAEDLAEDD